MQIPAKETPVTTVIGGLATGITWLIEVFAHDFGRILGFAWIFVGLVMYILYRRA